MKLFSVQQTINSVVIAEDWEDAEKVAERHWHQISEESILKTVVLCEIKDGFDLPDKWLRECIPYGAKDYRTIGLILDEENE